MPLSLFVNTFNVSYLVGGFIGCYILKKVGHKIDVGKVKYALQNIQTIFEEITL